VRGARRTAAGKRPDPEHRDQRSRPRHAMNVAQAARTRYR
jgi:hypothetical protein